MTGFTHPLRSHSRPSSHRRSPRATNEPHKRRKWMMDDTMGPDGVEMHNPSRATGGTKIFRDCARLFMQISRSCAFQQQMASCLALRRLTAPPTDGRMGYVGVQSSPHSKGQCGGNRARNGLSRHAVSLDGVPDGPAKLQWDLPGVLLFY